MADKETNMMRELDRSSVVGERVWWTTVGGETLIGTLKEWDNWTAIIVMNDGREKAVAT